jgi:16S rRNA (guanine527-N7)-methyltransferase
MRVLERELRAGLSELSLSLDEQQVARLLDYLELIQKWNKVYNLTAVRDPAEMVTHHLLDSLAIIEPLRSMMSGLASSRAAQAEGDSDRHGERKEQFAAPKLRLLDVGSGAGLPGVVIAICCPELAVDCVDAVAKKAVFVRQASVALGLSKLHALHARVESLAERYAVICSRAFASLNDFVRWSSGALAEDGVWMAMKGKYPAEEITNLPAGVAVFHVEQLLVPGLDAQRCLVWLKKAQPAPQSQCPNDLP